MNNLHLRAFKKPLKAGLMFLMLFFGLLACQTQKPAPQPESISTTKSLKIKDFGDGVKHTYEYDIMNRLLRFVNQKQSNVKDAYQFEYDPNQHLIKVTSANQWYITYHYDGDKLLNTKEFDGAHQLMAMHEYVYDSQGRLRVILDYLGDNLKKPYARQTLYYDQNENLCVQTTELYDADFQQFTPYMRKVFSDFDDKINTENTVLFYPFLPNMIFQKNNPRKITLLNERKGKTLSTELYQYEYNQADLPQKVSVKVKHLDESVEGKYELKYQ
jgi:YD repeat-containing protein